VTAGGNRFNDRAVEVKRDASYLYGYCSVNPIRGPNKLNFGKDNGVDKYIQLAGCLYLHILATYSVRTSARLYGILTEVH